MTSEFARVSLFDIEKDPSESNNLASSHPQLVKELLKEAELVVSKAPRQLSSGVRLMYLIKVI